MPSYKYKDAAVNVHPLSGEVDVQCRNFSLKTDAEGLLALAYPVIDAKARELDPPAPGTASPDSSPPSAG